MIFFAVIASEVKQSVLTDRHGRQTAGYFAMTAVIICILTIIVVPSPVGKSGAFRRDHGRCRPLGAGRRRIGSNLMKDCRWNRGTIFVPAKTVMSRSSSRTSALDSCSRKPKRSWSIPRPNAGRCRSVSGKLWSEEWIPRARRARPSIGSSTRPRRSWPCSGTEFAHRVSRQRDGTHLGVFEGTVDIQPAETAEGPQPPVQEVRRAAKRRLRSGRPIQVLSHFGPAHEGFSAKRASLRRRQKQIEDTWSPFTHGARGPAP